MSQLLIGTSGYDYPEWKGVFYPTDLPRKDFLSYYATQFNALEINNTFYNMPDAGRINSFYERSQGKLNFSIKANRLLTHEIDQNWKNYGDDLKNAIKDLQEKDCLSAVLFQFPQSFHYEKENRIYLADLINYFSGFPVVIEFRHSEWIRPSVFEGLNQRNASIVFCDMPQLKNLPDGFGVKTPFIGKNAYIRFHGRNENAWYAKTEDSLANNGSARYLYDYSDDELNKFVPVIGNAIKEGKKAQIYFNNHPKGLGAKNARNLKEKLVTRI